MKLFIIIKLLEKQVFIFFLDPTHNPNTQKLNKNIPKFVDFSFGYSKAESHTDVSSSDGSILLLTEIG